MRKYASRLAAALVLVACTGDHVGNPSAPRNNPSTAYLAVSSENPAPGSVVTMTIRPGAGDSVLGSFSARVHLPAGVSFVAEGAGDGVWATRVSGDTVVIAAAQPTGFADKLFAFDVRADAPENLALARLEMTEATPVTSSASVAAGPSAAAAPPVTPTWGDISVDGAITAADAQGILSASLSMSVSGTFQVPLGDANCDGIIGGVDAQIVLAKAVAANVSQFCVGTAATVVMSGEIRDAVSFLAVPGVKLVLNTTGADAAVSLPRQAIADAAGKYVIYNNVPDGTYSLTATANGYRGGSSSSLIIDKAAPQVVEATLTPTTFTTAPFASVSGRILTAGGAPVAGAAVQLSGGIQTNGPFKATTTGFDGSYSFAGVTLTDENKVPIPSFTVVAKSPTGAVGSRTGVTFAANEIKTGINVTVTTSTAIVTTFYTEGFDSGIPGTWTSTGLWSSRGTTAVSNTLFPSHVKLAPNDPSNGAVPVPMTGAGAAWAGSSATGNFIGSQTANDPQLSGGSSVTGSSSLLTSATFSIPAGAARATLYFDAWFEVESVNPNASGFDIMEITVTDIGTGNITSLTRLNPFEDPPLANRSAIPFTSGGFNRNPVWRPVYFNLDAYKGKTVELGFCFRTVDGAYNGFRGWLIDNVRVSDETAVASGTVMTAGGAKVGQPNRGTALAEDVASGFVTSCASLVQDIPVASASISPTSASLKITETAQFLATPFDAAGAGLAGRPVAWSSSNTTVATVGSSGLVTAKATGTTTIIASVGGRIASAIVTVGPPTSTMAIYAGNNQTTLAGVAVSIPPSVKITSASGQPVVGATVTYTIGSGGGSLTGGGQTTNANGIATLTSWITGATTGPNTLTVTSPAATNSPLTFNATGTATGLNLTIEAVQITQATQTMAGDVPLVAGRPAFIRVFVKAGQANTAKPTVRVQFLKNGTVVNTYDLTSTSGSVPTAVNEATLASSWNLAIPAADIVTGLSILADVDPTNTVTETEETDNTYPKTGTPLPLDVRSVPSFNVTFVPVTQPGGVTAGINDANKDSYMDFAKRVYPIGASDATVHAPFSYAATLSSGYDATWTDLLLQLKTLRIAEGTSRLYYGVLHPTFITGGTGLAYVGDPTAVGIDLTTAVANAATDIRAFTAAHEWGHNFNRRHVDCGGPANVDAAYPYTTTQIGANGYDVFKNTFMAQGVKADLMSYCASPWISDYTYKAVLEYRGVGGGGVAALRARGPVRGLLVWGQIGPNGIKLEPSFEVNAAPSLPAVAGPNSIQALDANGSVMFNLSFAGDEVDHMPGVRHFAYVVPLPQGGATASALRLRANGREVINRASAGGQGTASLSRVGARSRLTWSAAQYPMAMVKDAATGQIISFARGGSAEIAAQRGDVEVVLSNGVTSTSRRLKVPPQ